jgi:AcrR family transcriptional regulator
MTMEQQPQTITNPTRTRLPRQVRERQMVDAATISFGRSGFHGTSMDQIAMDAGISKPMLYAYFDSKEGLYLACLRRAGLDMIDAVRASFDSTLPAELQLRDGFIAFLGFIKDNRESWNLVRNESFSGYQMFPDEMEHIRSLLRQVVRELLFASSLANDVDRERLDEAAMPTAAALLGGTEAIANWWIGEGEDVPVEVPCAYLMSLFWYGARHVWEGGDWYPSVPAALETVGGGIREGHGIDNPKESPFKFGQR